jgi:polysaccharide export outer membrane protein
MNRDEDKDDSDRGPTRPWPALRRPLPAGLLGPLLLLSLCGCAATMPQVDKTLLAEKGSAVRNEGVAECYLIGCPDVLELIVVGRPEHSGQCVVGPDGRIDLGPLGRPRVEGRTVTEVARLIAREADLPPAFVEVRVVEFRSQVLYLFGEVNGLQRAVPYRGQETVLDLLQRVGGITPGAAPDDVHVVRARVAEGKRPEVFLVDLRAIVLRGDHKTNLRLQPFDQIHVGATRRARLEKCVPPWLRPLFHALCGQFPTPRPE